MWITILQWGTVIFNLHGIYLTRKTRLSYRDMTAKMIHDLDTYKDVFKIEIDDYKFHINRLVEEIELLKTSDGLYDVRNDPEKYQVFLNLLREKK